MKQLIRTTAIVFAVIIYVLSAPAQNTSDSAAIDNTQALNSNNFLSDSITVANYINLSKQYIDAKPDSALYWANTALQIAVKTNNPQILQNAIQQKRFVQQHNAGKINFDDGTGYKRKSNQSTKTGLLVAVILIIFIVCIYLSIVYVRKNNTLKKFETYYESLEQKNKELMQFKKEMLERIKDEKTTAQIATKQEHDVNLNIKERLIPMIAHDIRSPLASVQNMLSLTRENILSPEEFQKLSFSLEADIYNLRGMLDNMLLWTREQMVDIKVNKTLFNLSDAVKEVILMNRNSLLSKNITINNYLQPDLEVFSDKEITMAALRNIFSNAVKFTPQNRNIYINQIYLNKKIYISIKDEGKGMSSEVIEKIQSNEHISTRGTANEKGTGIGIMFTKDLLKKIDEVFDITSIPGHGTSVTFSIGMPLDQTNLN